MMAQSASVARVSFLPTFFLDVQANEIRDTLPDAVSDSQHWDDPMKDAKRYQARQYPTSDHLLPNPSRDVLLT